MKVLQVIDTLNAGGAERVFVDLTNLLVTCGVHTEVLLLTGEGVLINSLESPVPVHKLFRANKYSVAKARAAHSLCKQFDMVHVHMRHCYAYIRAVQLAFGGKYKIVLHDHYGDIAINKNVPLALRLPSAPKNYIGVSEELCEWASNSLKPAKVFLLRNTIAARAAECTRDAVANKAIMIANIRRTKNIEFAIDLSTRLGFELDIYGGKSDVPYYNYLTARISDNRSIRIIEGVTDFTSLYANYGFALHTAHSESGPLVLLEYLAAGMPFVSFKTGEVAKVVADKLPELFVDTFDIGTWETRINSIRQKHDLPQILRGLFHKNFSTEQYIQQCLQIYKEIDC